MQKKLIKISRVLNFYLAVVIFLSLFLQLLPSGFLAAQSGTRTYGMASYYADCFHGRTTASGEIFSQDSMTAAHLTLPFGTLVKVVNLRNNKSVVLKINDRGPFVEGRIIDLSKSAAEKLDFLTEGLVNVSVEVIGTAFIHKNSGIVASNVGGKKNTEGEKESVVVHKAEVKKDSMKTKTSISTVNYKNDTSAVFSVQVGSFSVRSNADVMLEKVRRINADAFIKESSVNGKTFFRVRVGKNLGAIEAEQSKKMLRKDFPSAFIVKFED